MQIDSSLRNFLDSRFTDGGEIDSITSRQPLLPERFLVFIYVRAWVEPWAKIRPEGLGRLQNPMNLDLSAFSSASAN
jgi:hypothetical protein